MQKCNCQCDPNDVNAKKLPEGVRKSVILFVLLVVIDLSVMVYSLYCLFDLRLAWYITVLIVLLMFSPGVGFVVQLGVIFYANMNQKGLLLKNSRALNSASTLPEVAKFHF